MLLKQLTAAAIAAVVGIGATQPGLAQESSVLTRDVEGLANRLVAADVAQSEIQPEPAVDVGNCVGLGRTAKLTKEPDEPWRLSSALGLPSWLKVSGDQRTRYESLNNQFRRGFDGSDQGLFLRSRLKVSLQSEVPEVTLEVMDSRQVLADMGSPLGTTHVNAVEPIQIYGALHLHDMLQPCDTLFLQGGRLTMDVGSRRLVARNIFRNTINTFTGVNAIWEAESDLSLQAFWTLPIQRLPSDRQSLLDNDVVFDAEDFDVQFWGVVGTLRKAVGIADLEGYFFGLHEGDDPDRRTRNRELYTTGLRLRLKPAPGEFDFELESVLQFGRSRLTSSSLDIKDLDHLAFFQHAELGYTFGIESEFRAAFQFDYASGDDDPVDDENNRFDTLFGARRFEFGPTGIFGPFARSNLITPGCRINFKPARDWGVMFAHRFYWLASSTDTWPTAQLRDMTGASGRYLGHQAEIRIRWDTIPGNLRIEAGTAYHFKGRFVTDAPGSTGEGDGAYAYIQSTITF